MDAALEAARALIERTRAGDAPAPEVAAFFDEPTNLASYIVSDPASSAAAIVDSLLDYDAAGGRTSTASAENLSRHVAERGLSVEWLLETHVHADHLSAAPWLKAKLGGTLAIGREIAAVQKVFSTIFNEDAGFALDGSQFDRLFDDGERFAVGGVEAIALHVPGHTPADMAYVIGDAVFAGDTLFMPDYGTARADFPGGDAAQLYRSIRRLLSLPPETRVFLCHDYKAPGRDSFAWKTTIGAERTGNVHVHEGVSEAEFVAMRTARDKTLSMPTLILPSVQVNMRGGRLPDPAENGVRYLKIPLDTL